MLIQSFPLASRILPGSYPGSATAQGPTTAETASTATIKPFPTAANSSALSAISAHENVEEADNGGTIYFEARDRLTSLPAPEAPITPPKNQQLVSGSSDPEPSNAASSTKDTAPSKGGIHRFTMVNQKAMKKVEAAKAKKQSACKSCPERGLIQRH